MNEHIYAYKHEMISIKRTLRKNSDPVIIPLAYKDRDIRDVDEAWQESVAFT